MTSTNISRAAPTVPPTNTIKAEDLATMFEWLTNTFVKAIAAQGTSGQPINHPDSQDKAATTAFTEYIRIGKCKRNIEGKVVLSSGAFVPREITGSNLKDRVDEWHRRNLGQLATGQMMFTVNAAPAYPIMIASRHNSPSLLDVTPTYQLTDVQQIASLECELFALRTQGARAHEMAQTGRSAPTPSPAPERQARTETPEPEPKSRPTTPTQRLPPVPAKDDAPIHPYAKAQDATYAPPHERNMGALAKIPSTKKDAPAYKTTAPIYDEKVAAEVYNRAMATQVTLTQHELLSLSAEVYANLPYAIDNLEPPTRPTVFSFINVLHQPETPPPGATIIPNIYETYLKNLQPGQVPQPLIVAKELSALRSIVPLVDYQQEVECVIDPGSQVIAMLEGICNELALIYDPEIILNMQSANAYDILLSRPFDILTESIIKNYSNEDQTITISDPNTGQQATIPTIRRGPPRVLHQRQDQGEVALIISIDHDTPNFPLIEASSDFHSPSPSRRDLCLKYIMASDLGPENHLKNNLDSAMSSLFSSVVPGSFHSTNIVDPVAIFATKRKYKPVAQKTQPVLADLPKKFRIIRNIIGDPLATLPTLTPNPPPFMPTSRYTAE
ncbi:hypothetical protein HETIRDRAFT_428667 [Heterobasidion irregulare TC 32-1]|uniref:Uncharacterized protein n=1 Tax=Heterobasidion irregulare (strain TC 32-1) TaxID=747525 RepID=W4JZC4_HETIT|nr:uncharacterized protein HETIRDRAFT_428667 [Heterobasidion irregulare TC 32-1]ETW78897.1 hypothetical protein HETIRDRAFT_428667 [Heterobasidion irregulare TC 32-1]